MKFRIIAVLMCALAASSAWAETPAQEAAPSSSIGIKKNEPVQIEASHELEWLRKDYKYRATGDVVITQGATVIKAKSAEANYDPQQGPSALTTISVKDDVVITNGDKTIIADEGDYDAIAQVLKLRGSNVTVTGPDLKVTAKNGIDYYTAENKAVAMGNAEVKQKAQTLRAQKITAWFDKNNKLQRAEANGNVVIVQPGKDGGQDIAQADQGTYDIKNNNALLKGHVKLTQGDNHMQGDTATIDLTTGYSTLKNTNAGGRVRAIFTPGGGTPGLTGTVPMVNAKKEFEPAYAVGKNSAPTNE